MTIEMVASVLAPSFPSIPIMCNNFVIAWEEVLAGCVPHHKFCVTTGPALSDKADLLMLTQWGGQRNLRVRILRIS